MCNKILNVLTNLWPKSICDLLRRLEKFTLLSVDGINIYLIREDVLLPTVTTTSQAVLGMDAENSQFALSLWYLKLVTNSAYE